MHGGIGHPGKALALRGRTQRSPADDSTVTLGHPRDEVTEYLRRYAETLESINIRTDHRVESFTREEDTFTVHTASREPIVAQHVIAATRGFGRAYSHACPGSTPSRAPSCTPAPTPPRPVRGSANLLGRDLHWWFVRTGPDRLPPARPYAPYRLLPCPIRDTTAEPSRSVSPTVATCSRPSTDGPAPGRGQH
ncbi:NAD(P)-binding domain-containing protein [Ornithinimicrobium cryptoxanthini]|uniref:NAD(P)-binding domain-containing protein n=1 Tax=Ornithinimicrobium cryptoxanthini TaxID=2934161 RepID=UPI00351BF551